MGRIGVAVDEASDLPRLPHIRYVKRRGKVYAYFTMMTDDRGRRKLMPMPPVGSPGFMEAHKAYMAKRPDTHTLRTATLRAKKERQIADEIACRKPAKEFVYFISSANGEIKIGRAHRPRIRLQTLQTGHPFKLSLEAVAEGGAELERHYHEAFSQLRLEGEWFRGHRDIWREIVRLDHLEQKRSGKWGRKRPEQNPVESGR